MAILTYPLNGILYNAEDAEAYLCTRESGVYSAENNFALEITDAMQISIGKGIAWIKNEEFAGKVVKNDTSVSITVPIADGVLNRIDRVVLKFDKAANASSVVLKQGAPATYPVAPAIVRDGTVYELGLYEISVNAGVVEITNGNVRNTMLDESVCGLMRDGVTAIPTNDLYEEARDVIDEIRQALEEVIGESIPPHASTHAIGGSDELTPSAIGAVAFGAQTLTNEQKAQARTNIGAGTPVAVDSALSTTSTNAIQNKVVTTNLNKKGEKPTEITGSGAINVTIADNAEYTFAAVTSLVIAGSTGKSHGFVTFSTSAPSISVTGFSASGGDDIAEAAASQVWEFSTNNGYILWKNWSA